MQKQEKTEGANQKILTNIKKDLNELIELNNSNEKEFDKIRKIISEMTNELKELEENIENKKNSNYVSYEGDEDINIKKKIVIKNKKKSKSFAKWMFNNKEL